MRTQDIQSYQSFRGEGELPQHKGKNVLAEEEERSGRKDGKRMEKRREEKKKIIMNRGCERDSWYGDAWPPRRPTRSTSSSSCLSSCGPGPSPCFPFLSLRPPWEGG